ncbi:Uncharacterised protein [Serratia rubidaea]|uniref:Lipoprotein n=1 Tax=Serratia rubidaea TaxID=61652 RepID=A0A4U9HEN7_SERRU|nr:MULTISPECIES: DUF6694 family lipoprotein [Serratia]QPR62544.1 hypothetical protein I6G83_17215 [Serratia rubidaea]CAI0831972.1 Uncharacterised protein [Serratia rubidaea]CAI1638388.1 Uncharacterised protein [Serratia rubidaea]VTP62145.1 Uncharacterised protein [Serratia rubidaea]HAY0635942.1 hypothetical protein [Serratia rubidaea]
MKRYLLPIIVVLSLVGCDQAPKFDGSSKGALLYSGENISASLSDEKKAELKQATLDISRYTDVVTSVDIGPGREAEKEAENMYLKIMDGKTVDEVIAESKRLKEKTEQKIAEATSKH